MKLVADIGGTNARFALIDDSGRLQYLQRYACADFPGIEAVIGHYQSTHGIAAGQVRRGAFSVALPVTGDAIRLTNNPWSFSRSALQAAMGWERLDVVNDFAAIALSLPHLSDSDCALVGEAGVADSDAPCLVLGPGTGLGVALLVRAGERWYPVSTEGGHVTLSAHDDRESELLRLARQGGRHVSAERLLSGMGLPLLHRLVCQVDGFAFSDATASDIARRAQDGSDPACSRTLETFFAMLGSVAGNLALSTGARGGVFLAGGILPQLHELFVHSGFRKRFVDKGRFAAYLSPIPTRLIVHENPALLGLARET